MSPLGDSFSLKIKVFARRAEKRLFSELHKKFKLVAIVFIATYGNLINSKYWKGILTIQAFLVNMGGG